MRALAAAVLLLSTITHAQEDGTVDDRPYLSRCFSAHGASLTYHPWVDLGSWSYRSSGSGSTRPSGSTGSSGSSGSLGSGSGGGSSGPEALLIVAVALAAALPIIFYVLDDDPDAVTLERFTCPLFEIDAWGGAEGHVGTPEWAVAASTRFRLTAGHTGLVAQVDAAPLGVSGFSVEGLLRPTPRQHLEGGLAAGFRRAVLGDAVRDGVEVALPHEYVLFRDGPKQIGIELRPSVFFQTRGVDIGVETALRLPITDFLNFRAGARAYSFDWKTVVGFSAGLSLHL